MTTDWDYTQAFLDQNPTRWGSLSWVAARPLIASINDLFGRNAGTLVDDLRTYWCKQTAEPGDPLIVDLSHVTRFIVVGDTGQQDASQYVVSPALTEAAAADDIGFVVIMSDVIYPSGDVNDYIDGFYKPYRSSPADPETGELNRHFSTDKRIFALPGNHDWYDGLFGFMYHFTTPHQPTSPSDPTPQQRHALPPDEVFAPAGDLNPIRRVFRILWRRSSPVRSKTRDLAAARGASNQLPRQPGPYYAIKTKYLMLFCIDTGIEGSVDATQMRWLRDTARAHPELPKLLLTGKPLVVNSTAHPHCLQPPVSGVPRSVLEIVHDAPCRFRAVIGGDIHNFQHYERFDPGVTVHHLVSGGGGAFTHATHPIRLSDLDPRATQTSTGSNTQMRLDDETLYPAPAESFSSFAGRLVPSVRRLAMMTLLFMAGVGLSLAAAPLPTAALRAGLAASWVVFAVMLAVHAFSKDPLTSPDDTGVRRTRSGLLVAEFCLAGVASGLLGWWLTPSHFVGSGVIWFGATGWLILNAYGVRWSGWWHAAQRPPVTSFVMQSNWAGAKFIAGLAVAVALVCLTAWGAARSGAGLSAALLLASGCLYAVAAVLGWFWWRHASEGASSLWAKAAPFIAIGLQAVVIAAALAAYDQATGQISAYAGAWLGIVVAVLAPIVMLAILLVLVEVWALIGSVVPSGGTPYGSRWRRRWGQAARLIRPFSFVVWYSVLAGWAVWTSPLGMPEKAHRASVGFPVALAIIIGVFVGVDTIRRVTARWHRHVYKLVAIAAAVVIVAAISLVVAFTRVPFWPVRGAAAAAVGTVAVLASLTATHLAFLDAYPLIWDRDAKQPTTVLSVEDAHRIITERAAGEDEQTTTFDRKLKRRANVAFPGLNMPFGPLQSFVSEIYSSHFPPFYKHFLVIDTDEALARITRHDVRGNERVTTDVLDLDLT
jgi:hypothetical protein